ncbi:Tat pathway signal sequence domain protein [Thiocapsa bogorovii]|uniref:Tat pathway signal sequence domain protein n=1 Tax=Thiocapsa bogorovii TaxID=521689 RepID=UPI001E4213D9|nr:Tat pathway signal sequence domain protein [Thiocapsa bogorovii]UHD14857.1 Tat pathway signal sequence domain protein [Thiocapsa bogorovii]
MTQRNLLQAFLLLTIGTCAGIGSAQEIKLELNKLEPQPETKACRAYLVFDTSGGPAIEALQLDLILFDQAGVIARRLAVDTAPLRAAKTTVKLFDIPDLDCTDIGRILINEVLECRDAEGPHSDCIERLTLSTRAETPLVK